MKRLREECNISRPQMAARLNITTGALWKIENGKTSPKIGTIKKFCLDRHIPLSYIIISSLELQDFTY